MKTLLFLLAMIASTNLFAQKYEVRVINHRYIIFADGKKFTGKREELLKDDRNLVTQPDSTSLILLSSVGSKRTKLWEYYLMRFLDDQWEFIGTFPGTMSLPVVTLSDTDGFIAIQTKDAKKITYVIFPDDLIYDNSVRSWIMLERK